MSASRISVAGDAIEVSGRFENEGELDAFVERLWAVFFAVHPPAEDAESTAAPINLPPLSKAVAAVVESAPAKESRPLRVDSHVKPAALPPGPNTAEDAAAFARLSPGERRAVLLMRKHRDRNAVAKIMEINPNSVTNYISAARNKGVVV